jgi:putative ABC transport system permease protein
MQQFLSGTGAMHGYLSMINVQASSQQVMDSVQQQITALLLQRHNISDPNNADFSVINQQSIMQIASTVTSTFTIFLASIAAISLLVGGIGIMNMMLTIVSERTREIGLRKAIGAKNNDISRQFLFESLGLTMLGGIIGIILGWLISFIIGKAISSISPQVTLQSVTLAFGVSVLIGVVFGYYPARQAAKLNPIDALRYE